MGDNFYKNFKGFVKSDEVIQNKHILSNSYKYGKYKLCESNINNNIFLYRSEFFLNKTIKSNLCHQINGLSFSIGLKGKLKYKSLITNEEYYCSQNSSNIHIISKDEVNHQMIKNQEYKALYFILKKEFLEKSLPNTFFKDELLKNLEKEYFYENLFNMKTDEKTRYLSNEIYYSPFEGELNELYMESKTLELIHHFYSLLSQKDRKIDLKGIKFSDYDIQALHKVKKILLDNMENPPSILELSKLVKLNDFKLKVGFKKLFNITPFAYLYEERMQKAKRLLEFSELSVGEVSLTVGYSQQQNFRKAFVKRFGVLPKDIMKNRKYYY